MNITIYTVNLKYNTLSGLDRPGEHVDLPFQEKGWREEHHSLSSTGILGFFPVIVKLFRKTRFSFIKDFSSYAFDSQLFGFFKVIDSNH